jgi:uncharacterized protein YcsI (UPF0317 family)
MNAGDPLESQRIRRAIREDGLTGISRGLERGFVQCNLVVLPKAYAFDFLLYCHRNQRACPVLEVLDPGDSVPHKLAPDADLRTDCARYSVFVDGVRLEDRTDVRDLWRGDLISFLIGSGITFDDALERAGVPTDRYRWVLRTNRPTEPAGPFRGDLIVTMRWLTPQQAITAVQVSARFPFNHGAPIHIGDPAALCADLANPLFGGPVPRMLGLRRDPAGRGRERTVAAVHRACPCAQLHYRSFRRSSDDRLNGADTQ